MYFKIRKQNTLLIIVLSIFTILLFFPTLVNAEIEVNTYTTNKDFTVMSKYSEVEICSCSTKYDSITITNTGSWTAIFTVSTTSKSNKITLSENSFELTSGQSKEVFLYLTADCNKGSEDINIIVTSNLGPQKTLTKKVVRNICQNIETWISNYTLNINPCESKNFEINIHNVGPFTESYTINSEYDKYISYTSQRLDLDANEYAKVIAKVKLDCEIYGSKEITFNVKSIKNKLTAEIKANINIMPNYDYEIKINDNSSNEYKDIQVCNRITSKIPISIKNNGSVTNEYTINIKNLPRYAKIEGLVDNKLILLPSETKTFSIEIDSTNYRYEDMTKELSITIEPKLGDIVKTKKINLNYMPCYEHELVIYDYDNSKTNPLRTCEKYDYSYNINLINKGLFKEKYQLTLITNSSNFKLSKNNITLSPMDNTIIQLEMTGPKDNEDYHIILKATSENGMNEYSDIWIKAYDAQSCHNAIIKTGKYRINYDTKQIIVPITNNGIMENDYIITWNGTNIIKSDIILTTINKSQTEKIILNTNSFGKNENTYYGQIILQSANGAKYTKDIIIKLKDKSVLRKTFEYLAFGNTCKQFSLYSFAIIIILIILIIAILIRGPNYPYKFKNRLRLKMPVIIFLIALFLIGIILVILIAGLPKNEAQVYNLTSNNTELTYEWLQNTNYALDTSKLFYDPENSTLKYTVTGLKNIKTVITDKKITFYPDNGWSGTEYAIITAYDNMGGKTTSPQYTLIVKDIPRKTFTELYHIYCWYANLIIYALILILIFVAVFVKQKKRKRN